MPESAQSEGSAPVPLPGPRRPWTRPRRSATTDQTDNQTARTHMREIGAFEAKSKLGQLLDRVEAGEDILITRRGKVVARLTSPGPAADRARARGAASRIRARRQGVLLGDLNLKDLITAGRRPPAAGPPDRR